MLIIYSERNTHNTHNLFPNNYDNYGNFCPFFEKFLTIMRISFHFLQFSISFLFFSIHDTIPFPSIPDFFQAPLSVKVFSKMTIKSEKGAVLEKNRLIL